MVKVIAVNAGSSSLKFQLLSMPTEEVIATGIFDRIGFVDAKFEMKANGEKIEEVLEIKDHSQAVALLLDALVKYNVVESLNDIEAVGHRVVHGGEYYSGSTIVTDEVIKNVEELCELAPLHNPANLVGYRAFAKSLPHARHVFVYDTAFHQTLAEDTYLYALPMEYYRDLKIRKYGAHGTSHQYVSEVANKMLGDIDNKRVIVCHLGNGASLSAVLNGKCIDTSMGFTPLAGVMMGTRSGDIDPSIIPYVCKKLSLTPDQVLDVLNKKSGMLGVSEISSDSREVEDAYFEGNEAAIRTSKLYARIISKRIGGYVMQLGGVDAIAFTAGLGENASYIRELVCEYIKDALGVDLNIEENNKRSKDSRVVSTPDSKVQIMIIPTNEEVMIARDTVRLLGL